MSTTIEQNVTARRAAEQALQLVIDYGKELDLSPEATAHYWECIQQQVAVIVNPVGAQRATPSSVAKINSETKSLAAEWSTDTSDEPCMPETCTHYGGQLCSEVNPTYFEWLAKQDWIETSQRWADVADWMRSEGYL